MTTVAASVRPIGLSTGMVIANATGTTAGHRHAEPGRVDPDRPPARLVHAPEDGHDVLEPHEPERERREIQREAVEDRQAGDQEQREQRRTLDRDASPIWRIA